MALERYEDQGYTYQQLRSAISDKIAMADTLGLLALINPTNIQVVEECDERVIGSETQTNTKLVEQLYDDYQTLKTNLAAAVTVDDVLQYFTSTNANLSRMSEDFEDIVLSYLTYSVADISSYVQGIDDTALAKTDETCL